MMMKKKRATILAILLPVLFAGLLSQAVWDNRGKTIDITGENKWTYEDDIDRGILRTGVPNAAQANLSKIVNVTDTKWEAQRSDIAVDGHNNTHIVWVERVPNEINDWNYTLCYTKFNFSNQEWGPVVNLSYAKNTDAYNPSIIISPGATEFVFIVWQDEYADSYHNIKFARGPTTGSYEDFSGTGLGSWQMRDVTPKDLGANDIRPQIAYTDNGAGEQLVHIVWRRGSTIMMSQREMSWLDDFTMMTTVWTPTVTPLTVISSATAPVPRVAVDESVGDVYIVYASSNTIYVTNNSGDHDWSSAPYIPKPVYNYGYNKEPDVAIDSSRNIGIVWEHSTPGTEIYDRICHLNRSITTGDWDPSSPFNVTLLSIGSNSKFLPSIEYDGNNDPHFSWLTFTGSDRAAEYSYNFSAPERISRSGSNPTSQILTHRAEMAVIHDKNIQFTWTNQYYASENTSIFFREYDRYLPEYTVVTPTAGNKYIQGTLNFDIQTSVDVRTVTYYWREDTEDPWTFIGQNISTTPKTDWDYPWDTVVAGIEVRNGSLLINVTDSNFLNATWSLDGITVDNSAPAAASVFISNVTDTMGHFNNATTGYEDSYFGGDITVHWNAGDDISGIKTVELVNSTGAVIINTSVIALVDGLYPQEVNGTFVHELADETTDAYWANFFLRVTNGVDEFTTSPLFPTIRIDRITPSGIFTNATNEPVTNGTKVKGVVQVNMTFPLVSDYDIQSITLRENTTGAWSLVGVDLSGAGGWVISWDTTANPLLVSAANKTVYLNMTIVDWTGYTNHSIIWIRVDNKIPNLVMTSASPSSLIGETYHVGEEPVLHFQTDRDTIRIEIYNGSSQVDFSPNPIVVLEFDGPLTETLDVSGDDNYVTGVYYWSTEPFRLTSSMYLKFVAIDDIGHVNSTVIPFRLSFSIPNSPTELEAAIDPTTGSVTLTWDQVGDPDIQYVIYRMLWNPNIDDLTAMLRDRPSWFVNIFLGQHAVRVGQVAFDKTTITDTVTDPHRYYYFIVSNYTVVGNLGNIRAVASVEMPRQQTSNVEPDYSFRNQMLFYGVILAVILVMIPVIGISASKKTSREKLLAYTMDQKVKRQFDDGQYGFDARLQEMDMVLDKSLGKEVKITADQSDFLAQTVDTGPEVAEISTPLIDLELGLGTEKKKEPKPSGGGLCPECGWILSATASKCPRCGYVVGEED